MNILAIDTIPLPFDTHHLARDCRLIHLPDEIETVEASEQLNRLFRDASAGTFITIEVSAARTDIMTILARQGADLIDIEIRFTYHRKTPLSSPAKEKDIDLLFVDKTDPAPFICLAKDLKWSRLYQDPHLPPNRVRALWEASIQNHLDGLSDKVAVAVTASGPSGFVAIKNGKGGSYSLFIVGILTSYRNRGIGTQLVRSVGENSWPSTVTVGTSIKHLAARKAYENAGFTPASYTAIYHFHAT